MPSHPKAPEATSATASLIFDVGVSGAQIVATGSDGIPRFAIADEKGLARIESPMPSGTADVAVSAAGCAARRWRSLRLAPGATTIKIPLAPGVAIEGVVLETDGAPIAGAHLFVGDGEAYPAEATSDRDGQFRIDGVPVKARVRVEAPFHQEAVVDPPADPAVGVEVRLKPAGRLSGTVCDPSGERIEGAVVSANGVGFSAYRAAVADASGAYVLDGLPLGEWTVRASFRSFADAPTARGIAFDDTRRDVRCDLALRRPVRLDVRVLDAEGRPSANATVHAESQKDKTRNKSTDDDGRTTFRLDDPGSWRVFATAFDDGTTGASDIDAAEGTTTTVVVRLGPLVALSGVVVDDRGHVVPRANVEVPESMRGWAESGPDGSFRMSVPAGTCSVTASAAMHGRSAPQSVTAPCGDLRLVVVRNGKVSIRLRVPAGQGPAGRARVIFYRVSDSTNSQSESDRTDGLFTAWLPPGHCMAHIVAEGCVPTSCEFDVVAGEETPPIEVTLDVGLTLGGRVVDAQGRPIAGARVVFNGGHASTDADGRFAIEHLPADEATAQVQAAGFLDGFAAAKPIPSLVVTMLRGGLVRGTVRDAADAPAKDVEVTVIDPEIPDEMKLAESGVDARGAFVARLKAGRWRVRVWRDQKIVAERDVELHEGEETPVDFVLEK